MSEMRRGTSGLAVEDSISDEDIRRLLNEQDAKLEYLSGFLEKPEVKEKYLDKFFVVACDDKEGVAVEFFSTKKSADKYRGKLPDKDSEIWYINKSLEAFPI